MLNNLLKRQIQKHLGKDPLPEKYATLFRVISDSYDHYEKDRKMLVRSIELSSNEMIELNNTLRKEASELKKAHEEIKHLIENVDEVFFSVDLKELRVLQMSPGCEKIYGYTPAEFIGNINLWQEVIHPDDKYVIEGNDAKLAQGQPVINQYRIIHKNKSTQWVEAKIIPLLDEAGQLARIDGVVRDITEKKIDEEKIMHAQNLLKEAQQLGEIGNWNINFITHEMYRSEGLCKILGIDLEFAARYDTFMSLIHPEDKERIVSEIEQMKKLGGSGEMDYRIIRPSDQAVRIMHTVCNEVRDADGKLIRMYGVSQDVTEKKEAEMKIEQLNMLIYQMSHDIRGPINSAKNYLYLASKKVKDEMALEYIDKISSSYVKIENYLMSFLNLQRISRSEPVMENVEMNELVEQVMYAIDNVNGLDKVKISTDVSIRETFSSDRQYLHSIIYNLIKNAIKYKRDIDDSFVCVSAHNKGNDIVISVSDNGIGMNEEVKSKIFEMFYKKDSASTGFGLGLYIVKSLVERLKGKISVESEPLKGTTFTISLPVMA